MKNQKNNETDIVFRPAKKWSWLFIGPLFLCFFIGFIWPFIYGFYLSFCEFNLPRDGAWVGLDNYVRAFSDPTFFRSFLFTSAYCAVSVVVINVIAFMLAYVLTGKIKGTKLFRTVFFMPNLIGGVVLGYIFLVLFNGILKNYGTYLTADANFGFWGLVTIVAWQQIGYMMIIYIAGLSQVPGDILEAAKVDGASGTKTLFRIIIPSVMPSIAICTFLTLTNSFKMFDQNLALTQGLPVLINPDGSQIRLTEMLALNIYSTYNIGKNWHGVAQAKAVIFFLLVTSLSLVQQRLTKRGDDSR